MTVSRAGELGWSGNLKSLLQIQKLQCCVANALVRHPPDLLNKTGFFVDSQFRVNFIQMHAYCRRRDP